MAVAQRAELATRGECDACLVEEKALRVDAEIEPAAIEPGEERGLGRAEADRRKAARDLAREEIAVGAEGTVSEIPVATNTATTEESAASEAKLEADLDDVSESEA